MVIELQFLALNCNIWQCCLKQKPRRLPFDKFYIVLSQGRCVFRETRSCALQTRADLAQWEGGAGRVEQLNLSGSHQQCSANFDSAGWLECSHGGIGGQSCRHLSISMYFRSRCQFPSCGVCTFTVFTASVESEAELIHGLAVPGLRDRRPS